MTSERKSELLRHALTMGGVGTGAGAVLVLAQALAAKPEMLISTISNFGPWFVVAMGGMFFVDRRVGEGIRIMRDSTAAQQQLADAVGALAHDAGERAQVQQLVIDQTARNTRDILHRLTAIESQMEKGHSAAAGS